MIPTINQFLRRYSILDKSSDGRLGVEGPLAAHDEDVRVIDFLREVHLVFV